MNSAESGPSPPTEFLHLLEPLYTAVVCDVLDRLGHRRQALPGHIRPLTPARRLWGRVYPAQARVMNEIPTEPYKLEMAAVDALAEGEVLVVASDDARDCAFWGELLTTACVAKGARGVVMSACTRDMWKIGNLAFPVFGIGHHPADSKGRLDVVSHGEPIEIGGVAAKRGDWVLGDEDGVVIVPGELAAEVIRLAHEKVAGENTAREELARGVPVTEVFRKHGIL